MSNVGGARVTTWNYNATRGFLSSKTDAAGKSVSYTYTAAGRLASRTWARGTNATYGYDTAGNLSKVSYSDLTPGLTYIRDRLGRQTSITCGGTTTSFAYDWANDVLSESYSGGTLGGLKITNQFDTVLRRTNMALLNGSTTLCQAVYGYDNASRLTYIPPAGVDGSGSLLPEANDFTLGAASQDVMLWKAFMYLDFSSDMRLEALEFTAWGYNGTVPSVSLGNCCYTKSEVYPQVTWIWAPGRPR